MPKTDAQILEEAAIKVEKFFPLTAKNIREVAKRCK